MANEATVTSNLIITKNGLVLYRSPVSAFRADVSGNLGPVPGAFTAAADGTNIDLSELTTPGLCEIANLEAAGGNDALFGRYDPDTSRFYPSHLVKAGERYTIRLPSDIADEYAGTGTGTTGTASTWRVIGMGGPVKVFVGAFEA